MGSEVPKQFLLLNGKPLIQHTIESFINAFSDIEIVLVLPEAHLQKGKEFNLKIKLKQAVHIVAGGETRFHSVKNGLAFVTEPSIVFVHDAVRCMISMELIKRCYEQALEKGSAIPAVAATDSIRLQDENSHHPLVRNSVRIVQTPQTFQSKLLLQAFEQNYQPFFTDEATVAEAAGYEIFLIEGEYNNLKITRPIDLLIAEKLMEQTIA